MSRTCCKISEGPTIIYLTMTNSDMMYNFIYSLKETRTNISIILLPISGVKIFGIWLASTSLTYFSVARIHNIQKLLLEGLYSGAGS
jgi:hypothetical protein